MPLNQNSVNVLSMLRVAVMNVMKKLLDVVQIATAACVKITFPSNSTRRALKSK